MLPPSRALPSCYFSGRGGGIARSQPARPLKQEDREGSYFPPIGQRGQVGAYPTTWIAQGAIGGGGWAGRLDCSPLGAEGVEGGINPLLPPLTQGAMPASICLRPCSQCWSSEGGALDRPRLRSIPVEQATPWPVHSRLLLGLPAPLPQHTASLQPKLL